MYVLLTILFIVFGAAIGFKDGDWSAVLVVIPIAATLCFGIVYFIQRAVARGGPESAWQALRIAFPFLIAIWIVQGVMLFLKVTGR